jgi:hypothetical protein
MKNVDKRKVKQKTPIVAGATAASERDDITMEFKDTIKYTE